jgi:hypothetical protein|tara:strand:+ start:394 stop:546 length:153 start_codon:yes stop_codon:yes gene_type:complete
MYEDLIEEKELTNNEVLSIVWEWYMTRKEILQTEDGLDLEELCELEFIHD